MTPPPVTAFVPARSGSKRLPGKNIRPLGGKPLLLWTLESFAAAPSIGRIILSTDSEAYWDLARTALPDADLAWDRRNAAEAGDRVTVFDYVRGARGKLFTAADSVVAIGLPTAPFRRTADIEAAIAMHRGRGRPVFTATPFAFPVALGFHLDADGGWTPIDASDPLSTGATRSQDQAEAYHPNGALYIRPIADFDDPQVRTFFTGALPMVMAREDSLDIDTELDFRLAEARLSLGNAAESG